MILDAGDVQGYAFVVLEIIESGGVIAGENDDFVFRIGRIHGSDEFGVDDVIERVSAKIVSYTLPRDGFKIGESFANEIGCHKKLSLVMVGKSKKNVLFVEFELTCGRGASRGKERVLLTSLVEIGGNAAGRTVGRGMRELCVSSFPDDVIIYG